MNSFSEETCPPGKSALTVEITCFEGDEIWKADKNDILEKILDGLKKEGFDVRDNLDGFFVLRSEYGYPVPTLGYEEPLFKVFQYLNNISNLYIGGRQAMFNYIQMFQALEMGFEIADYINNDKEKPLLDKPLNEEWPAFI